MRSTDAEYSKRGEFDYLTGPYDPKDAQRACSCTEPFLYLVEREGYTIAVVIRPLGLLFRRDSGGVINTLWIQTCACLLLAAELPLECPYLISFIYKGETTPAF